MADALEVIAPFLPENLFPAHRMAAVRDLCRRLAPVYWGVLEYRLGEDGPVDFHQGLDGPEELHRALRAPIADCGPETPDGWRRIAAFGRQWATDNTLLKRAIRRVGLEFDLLGGSQTPAPPSLFFQLQHTDPRDGAEPVVGDSIAACLRILVPDFPPRGMATIRRILAACPDGSRTAFFGTMLSRREKGLRLNVGPIAVAAVPDTIERWTERRPPRKWTEAMSQLTPTMDAVTVCLDIGERVSNRIGVECVPPIRNDGSANWDHLLDLVLAMGLCRADEERALLKWPGRTEPFSSDSPWPADLLVASLKRSPDTFSVFTRTLNHIKFEWDTDRALRAKAYLQFRHQWERAPAPLPKGDHHGF